MTRKQINNQWSGGIAAHPAQKNSECKIPLERFSSRFFGIKTAFFLLINYQATSQTINAKYYSSLLVQVKEKPRGMVTKGILFLHDNAPAHRAIAIEKKLAYLDFHTQPILRIWPRRTTTCSLD